MGSFKAFTVLICSESSSFVIDPRGCDFADVITWGMGGGRFRTCVCGVDYFVESKNKIIMKGTSKSD